MTKKHFEGAIESVVTCGICGAQSSRTEPFVDLSAHFAEEGEERMMPDSLESMLERSQADEVLD